MIFSLIVGIGGALVLVALVVMYLYAGFSGAAGIVRWLGVRRGSHSHSRP